MALFSPFIPLGHNYYLFLYYYSFSIHSRDHLASILNVTVGFLSLLYLVLFSFGFKNLHETFEILETLCTQLSQLSHFSHTYFEPYYVLIIPYFCPVPNFSLFLFCLQKEQPSHLACIFLSTLYLFIHNLSQKTHNPCFFLPSSVRALFCIIIFQFFSFMHIHLHAQKTVTPSIVELPFVSYDTVLIKSLNSEE